MNKIVVLIGTVLVIIAAIMQCIGTMQLRGSMNDQIDELRADEWDDDDLYDAYDDEVSAHTTLGISLAMFMAAFIFISIGIALPLLTNHVYQYQRPPPPPPPPQQQYPPRRD